MPLPIEEITKNLQERVNDLERANYLPPTQKPQVLHGIVREIVTIGNCDAAYLSVTPLSPTLDNGTGSSSSGGGPSGVMTFIPNDTIPISGANGRYDRVYCLNIEPQFLGLYYGVGDIVKYWGYWGTDDKRDVIKGTYVTLVEDTSFFAKIEHISAEDAAAMSPGCGYTTPELPTDAFFYKFTAVKHDPTAENLEDKWSVFQCSSGSNPLVGVCYNLNEVLNKDDGEGTNMTGTGVEVDDDGHRLDDSRKIVPLGPHVGRVHRRLIPGTPPASSSSAGSPCNVYEYFFLAEPNEFVVDASLSSSSSSSSSSEGDDSSSSSSNPCYTGTATFPPPCPSSSGNYVLSVSVNSDGLCCYDWTPTGTCDSSSSSSSAE